MDREGAGAVMTEKLVVGACYTLPLRYSGQGIHGRTNTKPLVMDSTRKLKDLYRPVIYLGRHSCASGEMYLFRSESGGYVESFTPQQFAEHEAVRTGRK